MEVGQYMTVRNSTINLARLRIDDRVRTPDPRLKSSNGAGFTGVRSAGQARCAYPGELVRTAVNCNPNCNPGS